MTTDEFLKDLDAKMREGKVVKATGFFPRNERTVGFIHAVRDDENEVFAYMVDPVEFVILKKGSKLMDWLIARASQNAAKYGIAP